MDTARLLKGSANLLMSVWLMRLVAGDLGRELRQEGRIARQGAETLVRRAPYGAAGAAAVLGMLVGVLIGQRNGLRTARSLRTIPTST
jgi:ElaB/YqjD/DUF883 family membrane-anchored ribosome-binding protein